MSHPEEDNEPIVVGKSEQKEGHEGGDAAVEDCRTHVGEGSGGALVAWCQFNRTNFSLNFGLKNLLA